MHSGVRDEDAHEPAQAAVAELVADDEESAGRSSGQRHRDLRISAIFEVKRSTATLLWPPPGMVGWAWRLRHIGEDTEPPRVPPARGPPQGEFEFDQSAGQEEWVEVDQTAGLGDGD